MTMHNLPPEKFYRHVAYNLVAAGTVGLTGLILFILGFALGRIYFISTGAGLLMMGFILSVVVAQRYKTYRQIQANNSGNDGSGATAAVVQSAMTTGSQAHITVLTNSVNTITVHQPQNVGQVTHVGGQFGTVPPANVLPPLSGKGVSGDDPPPSYTQVMSHPGYNGVQQNAWSASNNQQNVYTGNQAWTVGNTTQVQSNAYQTSYGFQNEYSSATTNLSTGYTYGSAFTY